MSIAPFWPALLVGIVALAWAVNQAVRGPRTPATWRHLAIALLVLAMALRPAAGTTRAEAQVSDLDVLILVDRTLSMAAEDHDGGKVRMQGVKDDVRTLLTQYAGARFAVMSFTHEPTLEVAFTSDTAAVQSYVDVLRPVEQYYGAGSRIDVAREAAAELLTRAATQQPDRRRVLVYLGDGEQTSADPVASFADLRPYLAGGLVLGYGTEAGGKMRGRPGSTSYVYDYTTHADAVSKIDEGNLRRLAEQIGAGYQHRTGPGGTLAITVKAGSGGLQNTGQLTARNDLTWALALLLLVPLLWELWDTATAARATRRFLTDRAAS